MQLLNPNFANVANKEVPSVADNFVVDVPVVSSSAVLQHSCTDFVAVIVCVGMQRQHPGPDMPNFYSLSPGGVGQITPPLGWWVTADRGGKKKETTFSHWLTRKADPCKQGAMTLLPLHMGCAAFSKRWAEAHRSISLPVHQAHHGIRETICTPSPVIKHPGCTFLSESHFCSIFIRWMYFISLLFSLCGCCVCSSFLHFLPPSFVLSQLSPCLSAPCLLRRGCRHTLSEARWDVWGSGCGRSQDCLLWFSCPRLLKSLLFCTVVALFQH